MASIGDRTAQPKPLKGAHASLPACVYCTPDEDVPERDWDRVRDEIEDD